MNAENKSNKGVEQVKLKNGFYEIPFFTDSPKVMMETYQKLHNLKENSSKYDITGDLPFLRSLSHFRQVEDELYLIQSEIQFKANVRYVLQEDSQIKNDYYCLSLQINNFEKNINSLADSTSYTDNCWMIFKPSGHLDHYHFSGTKGLYYLVFFTEQWLQNYMKRIVAEKVNLLNLFLNSQQDFLICPNFDNDLTFNKSSLQDAILLESEDEKDYLINLKNEVLKFISFFLLKMESEGINENHFKISNQDRIRVLKAKKILDSFLYKKFPGIKVLAEEAGLSETRLKECFKIIFDKTLLQYFQTIQMTKSKELIATGNYKIAEISAKMGYQSASKFTAAFKQVIGVLPSEIISSR